MGLEELVGHLAIAQVTTGLGIAHHTASAANTAVFARGTAVLIDAGLLRRGDHDPCRRECLAAYQPRRQAHHGSSRSHPDPREVRHGPAARHGPPAARRRCSTTGSRPDRGHQQPRRAPPRHRARHSQLTNHPASSPERYLGRAESDHYYTVDSDDPNIPPGVRPVPLGLLRADRSCQGLANRTPTRPGLVKRTIRGHTTCQMYDRSGARVPPGPREVDRAKHWLAYSNLPVHGLPWTTHGGGPNGIPQPGRSA